MKRDNFVIAIMVAAIIIAIFILGMITEKTTSSRTKYEFYSLNGEYGETYYCEATDKVKCEVDGNMIEVAQFSEAE